MKKRIFIAIISLLLIFSLVGCGKNVEPETEDTTSPEYYIANDAMVKPSQNQMFRYKIYEHYVAISEYIGEESTITIPDEIDGLPVYKIEKEAFNQNQTIVSLTMSNNIVEIEEKAFADCKVLKNIKFSNNLTTLGKNAFAKCSLLEDISLPDSLTEIPDYAFNHCSSLSSLTIPSNIEKIGKNSFSNCTNLKKLVVLDGVVGDEQGNYIKTIEKTIYANAFAYCSTLETILIPDTVVTIGTGAFKNISEDAYFYGYVPSSLVDYCANNKLNFIEVLEGDDKDRQMKDRAIIVPETTTAE